MHIAACVWVFIPPPLSSDGMPGTADFQMESRCRFMHGASQTGGFVRPTKRDSSASAVTLFVFNLSFCPGMQRGGRKKGERREGGEEEGWGGVGGGGLINHYSRTSRGLRLPAQTSRGVLPRLYVRGHCSSSTQTFTGCGDLRRRLRSPSRVV